MRPWIPAVLLGAALGLAGAPARAQWYGGPRMGYYGANTYSGAPGFYGVGYGIPSFGFPRTYSVFSSPYGGGYGYGYSPNLFLPGHYGVGLWRPGYAVPGYVYGAGYYRTFPVPYRPLVPFVGPPLGYYGRAYGPPTFNAW